MNSSHTAATVPTREEELSAYLADLTNVQHELLRVLNEKRQKMAVLDIAGLEALQPEAEALSQRLAGCQQRRAELLEQAARDGHSATNLRELARSLAAPAAQALAPEITAATTQVQRLREQSLTNWIVAQRTLLHVAEMLQILATGGRLQPTYGPENAVHTGGSLFSDAA